MKRLNGKDPGSAADGDSSTQSPVSVQSSVSKLVHALQNRSRSGDHERAEFALEKAELNAWISEVNGRLTTRQTSNQMLMRRIQMLELALHDQRQRTLQREAKASTSQGDGTHTPRISEMKDSIASTFSPDMKEALQKLRNHSILDTKPVPKPSAAKILRRYLERWDREEAAAPLRSGTGLLHRHSFMADDRRFKESPMSQSIDYWTEVNDMLGVATGSEREDETDRVPSIDMVASTSRTSRASVDWGGFDDVREATPERSQDPSSVIGTGQDDSTLRGSLQHAYISSGSHASGKEKEKEEDAPSAIVVGAHLDSARCIFIDEEQGVLVSGGEDGLIKGWDITALSHEQIWADWQDDGQREAVVTLRGHASAVLCFARGSGPNGDIYSGGLDGAVYGWRLPERGKYDPYGAGTVGGELAPRRIGRHQDAVWGVECNPETGTIASTSADGAVALWSAQGVQLHSIVLPVSGQDDVPDIPTCVSWAPNALHLVVGYSSPRCLLFDGYTFAAITLELQMPMVLSGMEPTSVATSPGNSSLAVFGYVDRCARLYDLNTGRQVSELVGHADVVTSVDFDRQGNVVTASHDGAVRLFDLRKMTSIFDTTVHKWQAALYGKKYEEAVHSVRCSASFLGSAGADGRLLVQKLS